jgi:preprotein translocase subunit SecD
MRYRFFLLFLLLLGLLTTACSSPFSQPGTTPIASNPAPITSGIRVLLLPATGAGTPTQATLNDAQTTLTHRLAAFGFGNATVHELTSGGQLALQVEVPHFGGDEKALLNTLLGTGQCAFWDTGQSGLQNGTSFDPSQYTQSNGGSNPVFTGADLDPSKLQVGQDQQTGSYVIQFAMKGAAFGRLSTFSSSHIGDYLTITLDRKVMTSAVIQSQLPGSAEISGNFTISQAKAVVSVLKFPPLPMTFQISSETTFQAEIHNPMLMI